jgi:hypothetical protein
MSKMLEHHEMFTHFFEENKIHTIGFQSAGALLLVFSFTGAFLPIPVRVAALLIGTSLFFKGRHAAQEGEELFGEAVVEESLNEALASLPMDWSRTKDLVVGESKIDHILVCPKGVYVIKAKNFGGSIEGALNERVWYQLSPDGGRSILFNPVKEVSEHAGELQKHLQQAGFQDVDVKPVVVFIDPTAWLNVSSPKVPIVRLAELDDLLRSQPDVMMPEKCAEIAKLLDGLVSTQRSRKKHEREPDKGDESDESFRVSVVNGRELGQARDPFLEGATFEGLTRKQIHLRHL